MRKKYIVIPIVVILAGVLFFGGFFIGKKSQSQSTASDKIFFNKELGKPEPVDFSLFWQALKILEDKYVDSSKINYQDILYGAISGMTSSLGDDYTVFMKPEKAQEFVKSVSGNNSFEGVGMEIAIKNKVLTVVAPLDNTPAAKAGIKAGDEILKINDTSTDGLLVEEAVSLIKGKKGTQVTLTIFRNGFIEPKTFTITRDTIEVPVIQWHMVGSDVAYIKIYQFSGNLPSKFEDIVSEILKTNAKKIILDLRNDPGGYLQSSNEVASWFIPKGKVVVKEEFKDGTQDEYTSKGYSAIQKFPIVVLVNKGSASASEILAGALRDDRGIQLIGEQTFGKGSVQELETLQGGASLKVTVAKWLTPSGISIMKEGLKPDVTVELTDDDYNNNRDPQMDKAVEIINKL